jgi:hypothetical protein
MRMVRMPGRAFASHSWQVRGNFGEGGDSGAWVIDNASGAVCGHVLAYSEASRVAYIAPMEVLLGDMERVLGARVGLPDEDEIRGAAQSMDREMLPDEISKASGLKGRDKMPVMERVSSPPCPTSPAPSVSELNSLTLVDVNQKPATSRSQSKNAALKSEAIFEPMMKRTWGVKA